jgi:hypothetical protein
MSEKADQCSLGLDGRINQLESEVVVFVVVSSSSQILNLTR